MSISDLEFEVHAGHITFWQGVRAHRKEALRRAGLTTVVVAVGLAVVLSPDYLTTFAGGGVSKNVLFFTSVLLISALIGFALGLSRYARTERWTLDRIQQELRVERRVFTGSPREEVIDLKHVRALRARGTAIEVVLDDMTAITLVRATTNRETSQLLGALHTFQDTYKLSLTVDDEREAVT